MTPESESLQEPGDLRRFHKIFRNATTPALYEQIVQRREGILIHCGPIAVKTGQYTGRSPEDKFIVDDPTCHDQIWWGPVNRPLPPQQFELLNDRMLQSLQNTDIFIQDCFAGARDRHSLPIRIITEYAWHSLFARNMFIPAKRDDFMPEFTVVASPSFRANAHDGTNSEVFIIINFQKKRVLIGGTGYAGEIKKAVFTVMNYLLPQKNVLPMHCSANVGNSGDVAIFFGLSGTGKTSLSTAAGRMLIGDDEHGWDEEGIFNFERGCYAKLIKLSKELEPEIYECTRKFGTILENVHFDEISRRVDLNSDLFTENTRACYPLTSISGAVRAGIAGHPANIIMLTCDAFGILPPIARLTADQAVYHFLSGYTAKVAGTERGLGAEPQAVFSACFGAPFMPLHPAVYAMMLKEKITRHNVTCWLLNTGWTGGGYGTGRRIDIRYSRAMADAAINGVFDDLPFETEPYFGLSIPPSCPWVPSEILNPRRMWQSAASYDNAANVLKQKFSENFRQFSGHVADVIVNVMQS